MKILFPKYIIDKEETINQDMTLSLPVGQFPERNKGQFLKLELKKECQLTKKEVS